MSTHQRTAPMPEADFRWWHRVALGLMAGGGVLALVGLAIDRVEFGYAWLLAYMVCLSLPLGALFLVMIHHLFDAGWSVPIRRACEHLACLAAPVMFLLWLPLGALAVQIYPWMGAELQAHPDAALRAKAPLFTCGGFYVTSLACFAIWHLVSTKLRKWSMRQDASGGVECTIAMRRWSAGGMFLFAVTTTLAAILWMKALSHQWFSTMYGVYYFAGSVWFALANVYAITVGLDRKGLLRGLLHRHQYYFLGSLFFAFTVFYAYIHFSQYFIVWNANVPEETFWYRLREQGSWSGVGILLIFGHFFLPFLALLRIDAKHCVPLMLGLWGWSWAMHFTDMAFNILPVPHPEGIPWRWLWLPLGCLAFMAGLMTRQFLAALQRGAPYPIRDPRLAEAMGFSHPAPRLLSGGELDETEGIERGTERRAEGAAPKGGVP